MAVLFFLFWVVLNGRIMAEIAVFGLVISAALYVFMCKVLDWRPRYDLLLVRSLPLACLYFAALLREIVLSSLTMAGYVFSHRDIPEPVLVSIRPPLKTPFARTLLASSITLTPGTITVALEDEVLKVHCYDETMARDLDGSVFVRLLKRWEAAL